MVKKYTVAVLLLTLMVPTKLDTHLTLYQDLGQELIKGCPPEKKLELSKIEQERRRKKLVLAKEPLSNYQQYVIFSNLLQKYCPTETSPIFNDTVWQDLDLLVGSHKPAHSVFAQINKTHGIVGLFYLARLLTLPTNNANILRIRQELIKYLITIIVKHPEENTELNEALTLINQNAHALFAFFEEEPEFTQKKIKSYYFADNGALAGLNTSTIYQTAADVGRKIKNLFKVATVPAVAFAGIYKYGSGKTEHDKVYNEGKQKYEETSFTEQKKTLEENKKSIHKPVEEANAGINEFNDKIATESNEIRKLQNEGAELRQRNFFNILNESPTKNHKRLAEIDSDIEMYTKNIANYKKAVHAYSLNRDTALSNERKKTKELDKEYQKTLTAALSKTDIPSKATKAGLRQTAAVLNPRPTLKINPIQNSKDTFEILNKIKTDEYNRSAPQLKKQNLDYLSKIEEKIKNNTELQKQESEARNLQNLLDQDKNFKENKLQFNELVNEIAKAQRDSEGNLLPQQYCNNAKQRKIKDFKLKNPTIKGDIESIVNALQKQKSATQSINEKQAILRSILRKKEKLQQASAADLIVLGTNRVEELKQESKKLAEYIQKDPQVAKHRNIINEINKSIEQNDRNVILNIWNDYPDLKENTQLTNDVYKRFENQQIMISIDTQIQQLKNPLFAEELHEDLLDNECETNFDFAKNIEAETDGMLSIISTDSPEKLTLHTTLESEVQPLLKNFTQTVSTEVPGITDSLSNMLYTSGKMVLSASTSMPTKVSGLMIGAAPLTLLAGQAYMTANAYNDEKENNMLTNYLQAQLMQIANMVHGLKGLSLLLKRHKHLNETLSHAQEIHALFDYNDPRYSADMHKLVGMLLTDTFTGAPSYFSNKGRVLAAYALMQKVKEEFTYALQAAGEVDAFYSCAQLFVENNKTQTPYTFANYIEGTEKPTFELHDMWNPLVNSGKKGTRTIITNSMILGGKHRRNALISGPNAGGKSTFMKGLLLSAIFGQTIGIVPAKKLSFTPFSKIMTYMNVTDDTASGKSLFMSEVERAQELLETLRNLNKKELSLCIMDELFSGTSPQEGEDASYGVAEELGKLRNNILVLASHFDGLKQLEPNTTDFTNYKVGVQRYPDGTFSYTFRITKGSSTKAENVAIDILRDKGFSVPILDRIEQRQQERGYPPSAPVLAAIQQEQQRQEAMEPEYVMPETVDAAQTVVVQ